MTLPCKAKANQAMVRQEKLLTQYLHSVFTNANDIVGIWIYYYKVCLYMLQMACGFITIKYVCI